MTIQTISIGSIPNDGTGDSARTAFTKINSNFSDVYPLYQRNIPGGVAPSGFFANNGVWIIGAAPSASATVSFSATSGSVTMTFSAATLLGTAADVNRVLTINDGGTYKYATITVQNSTTVCTASLNATLSGTGPFANNIIYLSGTPDTDTSAFPVPLNQTFSNLYLGFPANAIYSGSAAGVYYTVMSSTTVGTVYNNSYTSGERTPPSTPTAFAVTGTGAYTQALATLYTIASYTIAANTVGKYGYIRLSGLMHANSGANTRNYQSAFGGTNFHSISPSTNNLHAFFRTISNLGQTNFQVTEGLAADSLTLQTGPIAPIFMAIDTTSSQTLTIKAQINTTAQNWILIMRDMVEIMPAS